MKTFCANHRTCGNTDCIRKPTEAEIAKMQERTLHNISWTDYNVPHFGVKCSTWKELDYMESYHASA